MSGNSREAVLKQLTNQLNQTTQQHHQMTKLVQAILETSQKTQRQQQALLKRVDDLERKVEIRQQTSNSYKQTINMNGEKLLRQEQELQAMNNRFDEQELRIQALEKSRT